MIFFLLKHKDQKVSVKRPTKSKSMNSPNFRGRPPKPNLVKARAMLWARDVHERTTLTFSAIDRQFLYIDDTEPPIEPPKVFEKIYREGRFAGKGKTAHRRSLPDLVSFIDQQPDLKSTAAVFRSDIWEFLQQNSVSDTCLMDRVDKVFRDNGLVRYDIPKPPVSNNWRRDPKLDVSNPINPIEWIRLQKANMHEINFFYLSLILFLYTKTTMLKDNEKLLQVMTKPFEEYLVRRLGSFGETCYAEVVLKINQMQVVHTF